MEVATNFATVAVFIVMLGAHVRLACSRQVAKTRTLPVSNMCVPLQNIACRFNGCSIVNALSDDPSGSSLLANWEAF